MVCSSYGKSVDNAHDLSGCHRVVAQIFNVKVRGLDDCEV